MRRHRARTASTLIPLAQVGSLLSLAASAPGHATPGSTTAPDSTASAVVSPPDDGDRAPDARRQTVRTPIKVMTYNVLNNRRTGNRNRPGWTWRQREPHVVDTIRDYAPGLLGLQETYQQAGAAPGKGIMKALGGTYATLPGWRTKPKRLRSPLLWRKARFSYVRGGVVHLGCGEDMKYGVDRAVTWALLADTQRREPVLVANTHLSANGAACKPGDRVEQAAKIRKMMFKRRIYRSSDPVPAGLVGKGAPLVLMGDLNTVANGCRVAPGLPRRSTSSVACTRPCRCRAAGWATAPPTSASTRAAATTPPGSTTSWPGSGSTPRPRRC